MRWVIIVIWLAVWAEVAFSFGRLLKIEDDPEHFVYCADPNGLVVNDTVYVFCSHDQANAKSYETMVDYVLLSSTDIESGSWTNHGVILHPYQDFQLPVFKNMKMWAPSAIYHDDGYFYLFFPYMLKTAPRSSRVLVGIARSMTPQLAGSWELWSLPSLELFDPAAMRDPISGQVYLFGNERTGTMFDPMLSGILTPNLTNLVPPYLSEFGVKVGEAVFGFWRRNPQDGNKLIYYIFARITNRRKKLDRFMYWMLDSPQQPIPPSHVALPLGPNQFDSPCHGSIVAFKDKYYLFYHTGKENKGTRFRRSACVDEVFFKPNGEIVPVQYTCKYSAKPKK